MNNEKFVRNKIQDQKRFLDLKKSINLQTKEIENLENTVTYINSDAVMAIETNNGMVNKALGEPTEEPPTNKLEYGDSESVVLDRHYLVTLLNLLTKLKDKNDSVRVEVKKDYPIRFTLNHANGTRTRFILAPRVTG